MRTQLSFLTRVVLLATPAFAADCPKPCGVIDPGQPRILAPSEAPAALAVALRQPVDPNYELYLLETGTSVAPTKAAKDHLARVRWVIDATPDIDWPGLLRAELNEGEDAAPLIAALQQPGSQSPRVAQLRNLPVLSVQPFVFDVPAAPGSTAQGKGGIEFGWDVAATAGYVASGVHTNYAILAVPKYRRSISLTTKADWLRAPDKGGEPIPVRDLSASNATCACSIVKLTLPTSADFVVERMLYSSVPAGDEISVVLLGKGFTKETSILVNNQPLAGSVDITSSDTITLRFRLPRDFEGIPQITVVSPRLTLHLNDVPLWLNWSGEKAKLRDKQNLFRSGISKDFIMFEPTRAWPRVETELSRFDDVSHVADLRLFFRGIDLQKTVDEGGKVEFLRDTSWEQWSLGEKQEGVNSWFAPGAPIDNGYATYHLIDGEGRTVIEDRLAVALRPRIDDLRPDIGKVSGGDEITLTGANFAHVSSVFFGDTPGTILSHTDTQILVRSPQGTNGARPIIRAVSALTRDGKELASAEADRVYRYADIAPRPILPPTTLANEPDEWILQDRGNHVDIRLGYDVPANMGAVSFDVHDGVRWTPHAASLLSGNRASLADLPTTAGTLRLRLYTQTGNADRIVRDERTFRVPIPELDATAPITAAAKELVILKGHHLNAVTAVAIGRARKVPVSKQNGQLTVEVPTQAEAGTSDLQILLLSPHGSLAGPPFRYR